MSENLFPYWYVYIRNRTENNPMICTLLIHGHKKKYAPERLCEKVSEEKVGVRRSGKREKHNENYEQKQILS